MYTKFILFLFAGTIIPTQSYDHRENSEFPGKQYNNEWGVGRGAESFDHSGQIQPNARPSYVKDSTTRYGGIQSRPTKVGSNPGGGFKSYSTSSLAVNTPLIYGINNQEFSPQGTPIVTRSSFAENDRRPNYDPTHTSNGGGQLADTMQLTVPAGQPSSVQHFNGGSNNQQMKDGFNLNEDSVTSDQKFTNQGPSLQTSSQNNRKNVDSSGITFVEPSAGQPQSASKAHLELSAMESGIKIMQQISREKPGNSVISPLSILIALSTLHQGARGDSDQDLAKFLQSDAPTSRQWINDLINNFKGKSRGNILKIANAIFVDKTFNLNGEFKKVAFRDFRANVDSVNFRSPVQAASTINEWVSTSTGSLIPTLDAGSLDTSTQLLLTNAVFFKGIWNATFPKERTVPRAFALRPNEDKQGVIYMHQIGQFRAGEDNALNAKWVFLPFLNREFEMLFIMPNADFGLEKLINSLTPRALTNMLQDNTFREVSLGIPKFKLSFETDLVSTLAQLGIQSIFNPAADLSGLGTSSNHESLYVSKILHKAIIEINEEGGTPAPIFGIYYNTQYNEFRLNTHYNAFRFIANHPFLVLLFDNSSPVPLFMVRIVDP